MGKYRKYYLVVNQEAFPRADEVLEKFYNRGDLDDATVERWGKDGEVLLGLECSSDDYLLIAEELGMKVL